MTRQEKVNRVLGKHYRRLNNLKDGGYSFSDEFVKSAWVTCQDILEAFLMIEVISEKEAKKWSSKFLNRYYKILHHNNQARQARLSASASVVSTGTETASTST